MSKKQLTTAGHFSDSMPSMDEMSMIMQYCEVVAKSPAYAAMGGMPGVFAVVMSGRELGIPPMAALNGGLHLVPSKVDKDGNAKGVPQIILSARTMSSMILRHGHKIELVEQTERSITLKGTRADTGVSLSVQMTLEMARTAGLTHDTYGKPKLFSAWFKTPDDMLWKTCISKLGRRLFADVIGNAYVAEEFAEKEAKEEVETSPKKEIKGKNITTINVQATAPDQIEHQPTIITFEEFVRGNELRNPDHPIHEYVKWCAAKKEKSFEETLLLCYQNRQAFLDGWNQSLIKKAPAFKDELLA